MTKAVCLLSAGLLVATVACGPSEPDYEEQATRALESANLSDVDVDYDSNDRVLHVSGTVPTELDRQRAGDIVEKAVNNAARVANEVVVAGGNAEIADDLDGGIETRLENRIELDQALKDRSISFDANNGVVTITGSVNSAAEKEQVETMVRAEEGVRDVTNALEVEPATGANTTRTNPAPAANPR
jgi:osmotically-inducible protein OsmY